MKLKKIASLMLAGVMAVSMLTACGDNATDNGGASSEETTTTGVSVALYDELSLTAQRNITFSDSSKLDAALKSVVDNYVTGPTAVSAYQNLDFKKASEGGTAADVQAKLADVMDCKEQIGTEIYADDKTSTGVVVAVAGKGMSDQAILEKTAAWIEDAMKKLEAEGSKDDKDYSYSYTGSASIVEKSGVDANGVTRTVKYIAVSVTRTVAEV